MLRLLARLRHRSDRSLSYGLAWCDCGAQMVQDDANRQWICSDIVLGTAIPSGQPGALRHSAMPYAHWRVRPSRTGKEPVRSEPRNQPDDRTIPEGER